jgi:disulfide bond formation protein DsbB
VYSVMTALIARPTGPTQTWTALGAALVLAATVGGALAFQHIGGYIPCKLCYEQRIPYYAGIPLFGLAFVSARFGWPALLTRLLLAAGAILMAWSGYLGIFHSGVEWGWWAGPTDCGMVTAPSGGSGQGVLDMLNEVIPPSCDKAALRILGLSLAGWNAVVSFVLALLAGRAALARG